MSIALEPAAESRRVLLDDIVAAADESGVKKAKPVGVLGRILGWSWLGAVVSLFVVLFVVRNYEHQRRVDWVRAVHKAGLIARLEERWPMRWSPLFRRPTISRLFAWNVLVAELRHQA